ncbi:cytochrome P450 [Xylariaceae sp. FL1272]|nr:cytochrome P450 [Xylariaceae sp. FL1272]
MILNVPLPIEILILISSCYLTYLALSRCFLSPLAKVPGPLLAALTYWFECYYDVFKPAQYVFKIKALHEIYGPVIRIGPNDISISDPDFIDTIYAPGPGHKRDKDIKKNQALAVDSSVGGSISHDLHLKRREALNPFFSPQRIKRLDDVLATEAAQLDRRFAEAASRGGVVNLSDVYFAFCNDIVRQYCFGNSPDLLTHMSLARTRRTNVAAVLRNVKIMLHFGWLRSIMRLLPASISASTMPPGVRDMLAFRRNIRLEIDHIMSHNPSPNESPSIFRHLLCSPDLPDSEKSPQRLEDEATLLTMAGTYSPMLSLVIAHYHILALPAVLSKLRTELVAHPQATTATQLEHLPYLSSIIQEAHRLTFGLTGRNPRLCPDKSITYTHTDSTTSNPILYHFPPGTALSTSTLLLHTNQSIFPDPWTFDPERWLTTNQEVLNQRRRCMLSFSRGPRSCIGRTPSERRDGYRAGDCGEVGYDAIRDDC